MDSSTSPDLVIGRAGPPTATASTPTVPHTADVGVAPQVGAWIVYLGTAITLIGISWDIQWHTEVGPDTFFTLSHLALYTGSALSGIASLVMVLTATSAQRAGRPLPRTVGGTPVRVFGGTFTAPLGYLLSGTGAALFMIYGLLDLWWHSLYGFDAVLNSPPHVALFLSISVTMVGSIITFAAARDQLWGRLGVVFAVPILMTFAPITANALSTLSLPLNPVVAAVILFSTMLLIIGTAVLRRPGAGIAIAAVLGALQAFLWWYSPWAAEAYAAATGLPLRDGLTPQPPELPSAMPMFLIVAAAAVEGLFWLARHRELDTRKVLPVAGAVAGLIIASTLLAQQVLTDPTARFAAPAILIMSIVGIVLGALAGFLAGPFTTMLRAVAPVSEGTR
jgi:hypothetical protein